MIRFCHCRSQSVISTWLRGRLMTAAARAAPAAATVRFWMKACSDSAMPRCRLTKFSTSSNSSSTGASAAANTEAIASVPGGVVRAAGPSAATPASPASCRARSIHGVSRPSAGSHALPTKTPVRAAGAAGTSAAASRSATPGRSAAPAPARARWWSAVSVCVLPPPNCVISVSTGAAFAVRPDSRRSTIPACSVSARVKQVRAKNCAGSR